MYQEIFFEIWSEKLSVSKNGFVYGFKNAHSWSLNPVDTKQEIKLDLLGQNSTEYEELLTTIDNDLHKNDNRTRFQDTLIFIRRLTKNYSTFLKLDEYEILKAMEKNRNHWSANYYQEAKFTFIGDGVNIYETLEDFRKLVDRNKGFRCGSCGEVSHGVGAEYECSECGYKTYGFLSVGKTYELIVKDMFLEQPVVHKIFVPVSLEVV